jgi:predicted transcriptional regulator
MSNNRKPDDCPTAAEWKILNLLYDTYPQTVGQLMRKPSIQTTRWKETTLKRIIYLMKQKGLICPASQTDTCAGGRKAYGYMPMISKDELIDRELGRVLDTVFVDRPVDFVRHIIDHESISPGGFAEIEDYVVNFKPQQVRAIPPRITPPVLP